MFDHILIHTSCTGDDGQWVLGCTKSPLHTPFCPRVANLSFHSTGSDMLRSHEDVHETVGRIEDVLEFAVGVR